jgi:hypothetical protein
MFNAGLKEIKEQGSVLEKADGTFVPEGPLPSGPAEKLLIGFPARDDNPAVHNTRYPRR